MAAKKNNKKYPKVLLTILFKMLLLVLINVRKENPYLWLDT